MIDAVFVVGGGDVGVVGGGCHVVASDVFVGWRCCSRDGSGH